jgi:predicted RNA-binding Zn ribbon-like protein
MTFAHDTRLALVSTAALVNTAGGDVEELPDHAALDAFLRRHGWSGRRDYDDRELRSVRELRTRLRQVWYEDEHGVVRITNELLREAGALPQLVTHDGEPYHVHATRSDAPLATRMAVEAGMAFVEVVRGGELDRLRICAHPDCGSVVVDLSKNKSKQYCEGGCGNRVAVAAYRARKATRT